MSLTSTYPITNMYQTCSIIIHTTSLLCHYYVPLSRKTDTITIVNYRNLKHYYHYRYRYFQNTDSRPIQGVSKKKGEVFVLVLQYRLKQNILYRIQNILYRIQNILYSIGQEEIWDKTGQFAKLYSFIITISFDYSFKHQ